MLNYVLMSQFRVPQIERSRDHLRIRVVEAVLNLVVERGVGDVCVTRHDPLSPAAARHSH